MGESRLDRRRRSKPIKDQSVPISEFGLCVLAVAERRRVKPAEWLADLVGCTPRAANRIISGKRRSSRAVLVFAAELGGR